MFGSSLPGADINRESKWFSSGSCVQSPVQQQLRGKHDWHDAKKSRPDGGWSELADTHRSAISAPEPRTTDRAKTSSGVAATGCERFAGARFSNWSEFHLDWLEPCSPVRLSAPRRRESLRCHVSRQWLSCKRRRQSPLWS